MEYQNRATLSQLFFKEGVTRIGSYAAGVPASNEAPNGSVSAVWLPSTLTGIGNYAFSNQSKLRSVHLPSGATDLGKHIFAGSGLTMITDLDVENVLALPAGMAVIPEGFACQCAALYKVSLPGSIREIVPSAFAYCVGLGELAFAGSAPTIAVNAFTYDRLTASYYSALPGWDTAIRNQYGARSITWLPLESITLTLPAWQYAVAHGLKTEPLP